MITFKKSNAPISQRFMLTESQDQKLREIKDKTGISMCALVRKAIDELLAQYDQGVKKES